MLRKEVNELIAKQKTTALKSAVIIDGFQLAVIQKEPDLVNDFVQLCCHDFCEAVLVCRCSPQQKADVVNMVRKRS